MLTDFTPIQKLIWIRGGGLIPSEAQYETINNVPVATFTAAKAAPLKSLKIDITPIQASGTPTPESPLPISGRTGANIIVSPTLNVQDGTTHSISWESEAGTVYGGMLNVKTGVLTVTHTVRNITSGVTSVQTRDSDSSTSFWMAVSSGYLTYEARNELICSVAKYNGGTTIAHTNLNEFGVASTYPRSLFIRLLQSVVGTTTESVKKWLSGNPIQLYCKIAEPPTYQLTPTEVKTLIGVNNIWADTGNINELTYRKK